MDDAETVTDAVRLLEQDGYSGEFVIEHAVARCRTCGREHEPPQLVIRRTFRFEGPTDPGDEAIVLGVECPSCGARGIVVSAYGPDADEGMLLLLQRVRPGGAGGQG